MNQSVIKSFLLVASLTLLFAKSVNAEEIYIAQSALGTGNGTSATNAKAVSFFNTEGNWSSPTKVAGKIGPGDIIHLCGTITTALEVYASGTAGKPITIYFEDNAKLSSPAWPAATGAIHVFIKNYITIDGGTNGVIENTANGTNFANKVDSYGIKANNASYFTVKNLSIKNIYVRLPGNEQFGYGTGIANLCSNLEVITNYTVTNCTINDAFVGIVSDYGAGCSNYEFSYNTVFNCNWGAVNADRHASATMNGLLVHHNKFYNWTNWNDPSVNAFHHNGFFAYGNAGRLTNASVYANTFGPGFGNQYQTSAIYMNTNISNISIYNNVFICDPSEYAGNGMVTLQSSLATTINICNNTFVSMGGPVTAIQLSGSGNGSAQTINVLNNLGSGGGAGTFIALYNNSGVTLNADHNLAYNYNPTLTYIYSATSSGIFKTFSLWKLLGFDLHGLNTNPLFVGGSNYRIQNGSPANDAGISQSSYFTTDITGASRGQGSGWDIGAYEYLAATKPYNALVSIITQ